MKFFRPKVTPEATFDLTNMIDVVLLLIIFFMLTAQFAKSNQKEMDLPQQKGAASAKESDLAVTVAIERDGVLRLHEQIVDHDRLVQIIAGDARRLGRDVKEFDITIRADRQCSASHLNTLVSALSRIGVKRWRLATQSEGDT
jgi:biopolymer transport protein ExbD